MKILYLTQSQIPSRSANSIHVMSLSDAFVKKGHEVHLVSQNIKDDNLDKRNLFKYYNIKKSNLLKIYLCNLPQNGFLREFFYFIKILLIMNKYKFDMIYSRNIYASYLLSLLGYKTILELHSPPQKFAKFFFKKLINKQIIKCLITISNNLQNHILKKYDLKSIPNKVIRDAANIHKPSDQKLLKKKFRIKNKSIGYIGGLFRGRGIDLIIDIASKCQNLNFYIIGGSKTEVNYWKNKSLSKNIYFLGYLDHNIATKLSFSFDALIAPYQEKVFVHGSSLEGVKDELETSKFMSPLKLFEYMATEKPIITSSMPVLKEFLKNNYNCILCSPKKSDEWIRAINKIYQNPNFKRYIAQNALNDLKLKYSWSLRAENILNSHKSTNKILIFNANLDGGGAENVITIITNNLFDKNNKIQLALAKKRGEYLSFINKKIKIINFNKSRTLYCFFDLVKLINKEKPDYIFSSIVNSNIVSIILKRFFIFRKMKVIIRESNHLSQKLGNEIFLNSILKFLSKLFYKYSDTIISPTNVISNDLIENFDAPKSKIKVIGNPSESKKIISLSKQRIKEKVPKNYLIAIGRLTYQKNYEFLINSFYHFQKKIKNCDLIILGQGPDKENIMKQIHQLKLKKKIKLFGYKKNPFKYIKKSKMLVLSSRWEGYPNVLIQGMTLKKKIIATDCHGSSKAVLGNNGTIIKTKNPIIFAKEISKVYNSKISSKILNNQNLATNNINKFLELF